jgi:hypothetical protein
MGRVFQQAEPFVFIRVYELIANLTGMSKSGYGRTSVDLSGSLEISLKRLTLQE